MPGPSKVIVLEPDQRSGRQLQLGFEREGVQTALLAIPLDASKLVLDGHRDAGLVLVGGSAARALEVTRRARALVDEAKTEAAVVFAGTRVSRAEAEAAGADEIVARPAYLRDVVTIGRLLRGVKAAERDHLIGNLVEITGVYTLVRAFAALGRSAVLTLIRGLRRGEIRFYRGEVTSAQVGLIHGQAALHQLLLWTDARFDYAHEDIVRRHQIPLSGEDLFADAEQFLEGVREHAGRLSPSMVLEQDVQRVHEFGKQIPTEVHGVLRMFDGHRVLADVLEDSPYRVFETLRVAQRALEAGLLRVVESQRAKATWRAVLALEEWLVGNESRDAVVERTALLDSGPVSGPASADAKQGGKKKRKKRRSSRPPRAPSSPPPARGEIDWGALVPRVIGTEVGPLSGVVPAQYAHGEIDIAIASRQSQREGLEALMDTDKRTRIFPTEIGVEPSIVVKPDGTGDTAEWERVEWTAKQKQLDDMRAEREREDAEAKVREGVERMRLERVLRDEAEAREREEAAKRRAEEEQRDYAARALAAAEARRVEADAATASLVATPTAPVAPPAPAAAIEGAGEDPTEPRERRQTGTDANALVRQLVSDVVTVAETPTATVHVADEMTIHATDNTSRVTATPVVTVTEPPARPSAPIPFVAVPLDPVASAVAASISASDPVPAAVAVPAAAAAAAAAAAVAASASSDDSPSDGVVRAMLATTDSAQAERAARARNKSDPPDTVSAPSQAPATGEIAMREAAPAAAAAAEPSILVSDLASAHAAITTAFEKPPAPTPASLPDAASPARAHAVAEVRKDAVEFSESEEAFFRRADHTQPHPTVKAESFADLDEGYEPPKFWDRVFGRRRRSSTTQQPIIKPKK
jgi:hypothetical protein